MLLGGISPCHDAQLLPGWIMMETKSM